MWDPPQLFPTITIWPWASHFTLVCQQVNNRAFSHEDMVKLRWEMITKVVNNYQVKWLCARHCSKPFTDTLSFNPHCSTGDGLPRWLSGKESTCQCRRQKMQVRSLGEGNGSPLQYSCLGNLMERGAWQAKVPWITELDTIEQLSMLLHNTGDNPF